MQEATLYRHADGELRDKPQRTHGGKITQRYCAVRVTRDGTRIFERAAEISVRSLKSVGGARAGCNHTKRKNRYARKLGHSSWAHFMAVLRDAFKGDRSGLMQAIAGAVARI